MGSGRPVVCRSRGCPGRGPAAEADRGGRRGPEGSRHCWRKREQWYSLAERAPDDATADYLHAVFEPTARAIDGLEKSLDGLGLLEGALALDMRRPQDYFHRLWATGLRTVDLAAASGADQETP